MKGLRGWRIILLAWILCLCMGVIVYASTNLIENHECTYVYSVVKVLLMTCVDGGTHSCLLILLICIFKEIQISKLLGSVLSFMALLGFHGYILTKFYRRKRRQETFNNDKKRKGYKNQQKVSFSSQENGQINQILSASNSKDHHKVSRRLSELSFHVSYIKSSNYILITLSAFCLCHLPMFFHQLFELIRYEL